MCGSESTNSARSQYRLLVRFVRLRRDVVGHVREYVDTLTCI
jgi:hypothetical protein